MEESCCSTRIQPWSLKFLGAGNQKGQKNKLLVLHSSPSNATSHRWKMLRSPSSQNLPTRKSHWGSGAVAGVSSHRAALLGVLPGEFKSFQLSPFPDPEIFAGWSSSDRSWVFSKKTTFAIPANFCYRVAHGAIWPWRQLWDHPAVHTPSTTKWLGIFCNTRASTFTVRSLGHSHCQLTRWLV